MSSICRLKGGGAPVPGCVPGQVPPPVAENVLHRVVPSAAKLVISPPTFTGPSFQFTVPFRFESSTFITRTPLIHASKVPLPQFAVLGLVQIGGG